MIIELTAALVLVAAVLALNSWTATFVLCTIVAILQDPLRKVAPEQPVYFVVLVGVVFGAGWLGALGAKVPLGPRSIRGWERNVGAPFVLFVAITLAQAGHSFILFGSAVMTGIGLLSYLSAPPAFVLAYQYAIRSGTRGITSWMWTYIVVAGIALSGVYLEYAGVGWPVLGQVGEGLIIYDVGRALKAYSGFFRAAEIAAWHTATIACWLIMLLFGKRRSLPGLVGALALVMSLLALGTLTGRRKLLVQVAVFVFAYFGLFALYQKNSRKLAGVVGVVGLAAYLFVVGFVGPDPGERRYESHNLIVGSDEIYSAYALRTRSVVEDVGDRLSQFGFQYAVYAYEQWGFFGAGLGAGSQGTQHFGGDAMINRGAAEAGLGKIMLELGLPGVIVVAWFGFGLARYIGLILDSLVTTSLTHARLGFGFVAFLVANLATFSVSTQAYGDVFILLCLGWSTGFLLALPTLAVRERQTLRARSVVTARARVADMKRPA